MAIQLGRIARPEEDVFATTGAHLDVRVIPQYGKQKGQKIDPRTAPTGLLSNIQVGGTPLMTNGKFNFPVTSGFGPRKAPVAGASTYHQGIDLGIGAGTNLSFTGQGNYVRSRGYGTLSTTDALGNPYDIQLLHTVGEPTPKADPDTGKQYVRDPVAAPSITSEVPSTETTEAKPGIPSISDGVLTDYFKGRRSKFEKRKERANEMVSRFASSFLNSQSTTDSLINQLIGGF